MHGEDRRRRRRARCLADRSARFCAKGENISPGYYENPAATAETFKDGWLFTGDMGYLDEDGYLFVVERKKDLIIRGGLNVYPKDVEEVLLQAPGGRSRRRSWASRTSDGRRGLRRSS